MKSQLYLLFSFSVLLLFFFIFFVNYKINNNLNTLKEKIIPFLYLKENEGFIFTGIKLIAKHSKTKEEFLLNLEEWARKAGIKYEVDNVFLINNSFVFYSNNSLFNNNLKIYYKGRYYEFKRIKK